MQIPEGYILITKVEYEQFLKQKEQIELLMARVKELESLLLKTSKNSHNPPGSDGLRSPSRITGKRVIKSNREAGGQKGHEGATLEMVDKPDKVIKHKVRGH